MSKISIIGLSGPKQSGKSMVADYLSAHLGAKMLTLAAKLKTVCSQVSDLPLSYFEDQDKKESPFETPVELTREVIRNIAFEFDVQHPAKLAFDHLGRTFTTPREMLQYVGTDMLRNLDRNIHCKTLDEVIDKRRLNVVTDVRFINELEYLSNIGATIIYIERTWAENRINLRSHQSEKEVLECKKHPNIIIVNNDGSPNSTFEQVVSIIRGL